MKILGIVVFGVSSLVFLRVYLSSWPDLTLKKILLGVITSSFAGMGAALALEIPLSIGSILVAGLFASIGGFSLLVGHWVSNKLFARYNKISLIQIKEVIMTTTMDENGFPIGQTYSFHQTAPRIYCFIIHYSIMGRYSRTTLIAEWYYETEKIKCHSCRMYSDHPITLWIEPTTEEGFQPGRYTVKLFVENINRVLVKTVEFKIVSNHVN